MRWGPWWKGALAAGLVTMVSIAPALVLDGVNAAEVWAMFSSFLGGIRLWCQDHKIEWDGVERRKNP